MSFFRKMSLFVMVVMVCLGSSTNVHATSKRELYELHCGIAKESVTSKMKKLSRREIIAQCAGTSIQAQSSELGVIANQNTTIAGRRTSIGARSDMSGRTRNIRISGGSMAHVGIKDGSTVRVVAKAPNIGDHIVFSSPKCGGSGCLKTLTSINDNGCIWVKGRPGSWGNGNYSVDSSRYGWICDYRISGIVR